MKTILHRNAPYLAGLLGALIYIIIYGLHTLNPFYTDFLRVTGDLGQHYYGWELYRFSDSFILPGLMNKASYPYSVSVLFTDSIPLMAVLCKPFSLFTNSRLQYFGIWELICFYLQGFWGYKLIDMKSADKATMASKFIATFLIILSPCMLRRVFYHIALSSHFLILIALYLTETIASDTKCNYILKWALLGGLAASIHLYFIVIIGIVFVDAIIITLVKYRDKLLVVFLSGFSYCLSALVVVFILGGFNSGMSSGAPGIGYYSLNLLSFFQSDDDFNTLMPPITYYEAGQYEGLVYLGGGMLLLLILALFLSIYGLIKTRSISLHNFAYHIPSFLISLILATGGLFTFGSHLIYEYRPSGLIETALSVVRASGRLALVCYYILFLYIIRATFKINNARILLLIIALSALIQLADMFPQLEANHTQYTREYTYESPFPEVIELLSYFNQKKHLVFLNKDFFSQDELYGFADYAISNNMTINDFYFARYFTGKVREIADSFAKRGRTDCIFILRKDNWSLALKYDNLSWYEAGEFYIGVSK